MKGFSIMKIKRIVNEKATCKKCFFREKATGICETKNLGVKMKCMIKGNIYIFVLERF